MSHISNTTKIITTTNINNSRNNIINKTSKSISNKTINEKKQTNKHIITEQVIDLKYINNRINNEVCYNTINKLKDNVLLSEYKQCKSVQNQIKKLKSILEKYNINNILKQSILNDYIYNLIPAGTKGVIRGNKFNTIVKDTIINLKLDNRRYKICFEQQSDTHITTEIPDWYILEKSTGKIIIGMNQLDLFGGGQQTNRGYKYLIDNKYNTNTSKLLCVICNYIQFKTYNKKTYLFEIGFKNNTLTYLKNLGCIIKTFFNI